MKTAPKMVETKKLGQFHQTSSVKKKKKRKEMQTDFHCQKAAKSGRSGKQRSRRRGASTNGSGAEGCPEVHEEN